MSYCFTQTPKLVSAPLINCYSKTTRSFMLAVTLKMLTSPKTFKNGQKVLVQKFDHIKISYYTSHYEIQGC